MLPRDEYLASFERDVARVAALGPTTFDLPVPSCPDWDVRALIDHMSTGERWWAMVLRMPEGQLPASQDVPVRPPVTDPVAWFKDSMTDVADAVRSATPSTPITWLAHSGTASFVFRRIAHELAIHRWDAQAAAGMPDGFDGALARDGVDELLELWVPIVFDYAALDGSTARIHLHAQDDDTGWLIDVGADSTAWRHGHEPADVTARGAVADLYLAIWGRPCPSLQVEGDSDLLAGWQSAGAVQGQKLTRSS